MTASQHQARARAIIAEITQIAQAGAVLPGALVSRSTACGRPGCQCTADPPQLHGPYTSWMRRSDDKHITRAMSPDQEARYRPWFDNARRLRALTRELITELEDLSLEAFEEAEGPRTQRKDAHKRA